MMLSKRAAYFQKATRPFSKDLIHIYNCHDLNIH